MIVPITINKIIAIIKDCIANGDTVSDNIENGSIEEAMKIMELIEKIYQSDPEWQAKYY